jgi:hypothetical protein
MDEDDGQWLSYVELAVHRGISRASAERLVRRKGWRRQSDNQGNVRVLVPVQADGRAGNPGDIVRQMASLQQSFDAAIAAFRTDLERERGRADRAEAQIEALRRADADRKAASLIARLRAAWRRE